MNKKEVKISVSNITKKFELMKTRSEKILNLFNFSSTRKKQDFWALKGISFDVYAGEAIGIVGLNGSGKSTLLNIVSEIYPPTTGDIVINGDTSIISIGAGLKSTLTGRDNIKLKLLMSGLSNKEIKQVIPTIIEFSELGDFIEQPVKSYSSGMKAKLGFSIMAHTNPDIMIIDEALSVGDSTFAKKSFDKIREFKEHGKTIFFVSHSAGQVKQIADRVIWMHFGEMREIGTTKDVMSDYSKWQSNFNEKPKDEREKYIVEHKHAQQSLSALDIARKQLNIETPKINTLSRVERIEAKNIEDEQQRLVKKATKRTKKQIQNVKFGFINWIIVGILVLLIGYVSTDVLANSQKRRDDISKELNVKNTHKKNSRMTSSIRKVQKSKKEISVSSSIIQGKSTEDSTNVEVNNDTSTTDVINNQESITPNVDDSTSQEYYQSSETQYSQPYYSNYADANVSDTVTETSDNITTSSDSSISSVSSTESAITTETEAN